MRVSCAPKNICLSFFAFCCVCCFSCVFDIFYAGQKTTARPPPVTLPRVVSEQRASWETSYVVGIVLCFLSLPPLCYFSRTRQRELISDVLRSCCSTIFRAIFGGNIPSKGIFFFSKPKNKEETLTSSLQKRGLAFFA